MSNFLIRFISLTILTFMYGTMMGFIFKWYGETVSSMDKFVCRASMVAYTAVYLVGLYFI